ncbi:T9SS type A sorting domain-containing protein [Dawidia soli]|uniref:T9SS type A sorting domain-containing protein n=1 Tax=Dawidia soli TaxID=2782352 RepID=A0AAP2GFW3_9BACT|nr:T9SS type A sorting domain-containing protein [Dawidia soli]MBT1689899.1 T9SS type A sorting domain-containing protein [Dawidia soli]
MKNLLLSIALLTVCTFTGAQDQFTNTGNFQTFSGATLAFFGDFVNTGTFTDDAQSITFKGGASQLITGSSALTFNNFIADNAVGVSLQSDVNVTTTLTLTAGKLDLNSRRLTILSALPTAVARTGGYILSEKTDHTSQMRWAIGTNTAAHVFPFGTSSGVYIPCTVLLTAGDLGNVTVSSYPTAANNMPYPTAPIAVTDMNRQGVDNSANVVDRFWQIDKDGPAATVTVTFQAGPAEVGSITSLQAQRWNSTTSIWETPLPGQTSNATSVTVPDVTDFSPWTLSGNNSPLPVELITFTATGVETRVEVSWITATERNNDYFTVQRSKDGHGFVDIGTVAAGPNGYSIQEYGYTDYDPFPGKSYYRLKQTDLDGTEEFLDIKMVRMEEHLPGLMVYPNPVENGKLSVDFRDALTDDALVTISDVVGKVIFRSVATAGTRFYPVDLASSPAGVYMLRIANTQSSFEVKIVLK